MRRLAFILLLMCVLGIASAGAQRRINPVTPPPSTAGTRKDAKPAEFDKSRLAEMKDAQGNTVLVDTVSGEEYVDTTAMPKVVGNIYPLLHAVTVGVDVWDPVMKILGQQYGGIGFWGELSLHNRFKPVVEFGLSSADISPDGFNYTFKSPMAPYFKIGAGYNVFYNSNPDYQLVFGIRYGFTPYKWHISGQTNAGYWPSQPIDIPDQKATAGYFELTAGIKVKIYRGISLGWHIKYHSLIHESKSAYGKPMYIPGYGKRGTPISGGFSIMYTLPLNKKTTKAVDTSEGVANEGTP